MRIWQNQYTRPLPKLGLHLVRVHGYGSIYVHSLNYFALHREHNVSHDHERGGWDHDRTDLTTPRR